MAAAVLLLDPRLELRVGRGRPHDHVVPPVVRRTYAQIK
jgi:hypothetical protein